MKSATAEKTEKDEPRQGEIRSNTIPYLIHELAAARETGVLAITQHDVRKSIQFTQGNVTFASSNQRDDRFNQVLLREGVLSLKNVLKALEVALATKERLGEVMVSYKMLSPADVQKWIEVQVRDIVYSVFQWTSGHFKFDRQPARPEGLSLNIGSDALVIEGVRRVHSWARAYEEVGGLHAEFLTTREAPALSRTLPLTAVEKDLLKRCEQGPMTLEEMCDEIKQRDYEVCRSIWGLLAVGALMKS